MKRPVCPVIGIPAITGSEVLEEFVGLFLNQATDAAVLDERQRAAVQHPGRAAGSHDG